MAGRLKLKGFASSAPAPAPTPPARDSPMPSSSSKAKNTPSSSLKRKLSPPKPQVTPLSTKLPKDPSRREALERTIKLRGKLLHRWKNGNFYYEAIIAKIIHSKDGEVKYVLHYAGWGRAHDATLTKEEILDTCRLWTKEDAEIANKEVKEAQKVSFGGSTRKTTSVLDDRESSPISESKKAETRTPTSPPSASVKVVESSAGGIQIPSKLEKMSKLEYVFPPKLTIEKALGMYAKKLNKKGESPCPPHTVEMVVDTFLQCIQTECSEYLPVLLTTKELTEYYNLLNAKRASLGQPPIDIKNYRDSNTSSRQDDKSKRNSFPEVMLPMADSFDVIYFVRFVKRFNETLPGKSFMKIFYEPLFNDILKYIDGNINAKMYDDLD